MQVLRNKAFSLAALGLFTGFSASAVQGCGEGGICGPCGSVLEGSVSIVNNAQIDGFFAAVAQVNNVFISVKADFDANIRALAEVWGYAAAEGEIDASYVGDLMGHIKGEISANVSGGLRINYVPPKCSANVSVAVEAQASCEAQAECDVEVDPGEVSVACEGKCSGGCSAECSGAVACQVEGGISCEGSCEGACEIEAGAACEGTCRGECDGTCSVQNAAGECEGSCEGTCSGTCEVQAGASCSGTCHGSCVTEAPSAECMATAECRGECSGECSGSCEGSATPPSASADCEASANCQASASAQANASFECTPPSLDIGFELNGGLDASAQAAFTAKIGELRIRGVAILQGFAQLKGLVQGVDIDGDGNIDIDVLGDLRAGFNGALDAGLSGDIKIPPGRIDCLAVAVAEALDVLVDVGANAGGTITAQASFSTELFGAAG